MLFQYNVNILTWCSDLFFFVCVCVLSFAEDLSLSLLTFRFVADFLCCGAILNHIFF